MSDSKYDMFSIESMTGSNVIHFNQVDCGVAIEFRYDGVCTGTIQIYDSTARKEMIDNMIDEFDGFSQ